MPFNANGDLHKDEIVSTLNERGYDVKNVHSLNQIMENMGLQEHVGNSWLTTDKGADKTIYSGKVYNADGWRSSVVDDISGFLDNQQ